MKQAFLDQWCENLESGKYKQAKGVLKLRKDTFCCLGLACNMINDQVWEKDRTNQTDHPIPSGWDHLSSRDLPYDVLNLHSSYIENRQIQDELAGMNDAGTSFKQIAKWIRKNVKATE